MIIKGQVKKGEYFDSVSLMMASKKLGGLPGILDSAIVMGTSENKAILSASGMMLNPFNAASDTDLLMAVKADSENHAIQALKDAETILSVAHKRDGAESTKDPCSFKAALGVLPQANLALISVAGRYAGVLAQQALQRDLNVMIFSDNVPLEQEISLKQFALERGLIVMGPDCGTAIINGVPLAFANVVSRGNIGIVAAAGTGLQEVSCLISHAGAGISQAIGTGGRDVKKAVGGLMLIEGLQRLGKDPDTEIIVLISKPPDAEVFEKIGKRVASIQKPVVAVFLGSDEESIRQYGMIPATTLADAARISVVLSRGEAYHCESFPPLAPLDAMAKVIKDKRSRQQKYIRGLFSGGTFCYEAQILLQDLADGIYSNAPIGKSRPLEDSLKSRKHTLIDLGADEFTVGRLHPMIDYTLRNKRILEEAANPETAIILLDIVLGFGSHPDPLSEIRPPILQAQQLAREQNRHLSVICSVTGTDSDPQNRSQVVAGLSQCGVIVAESNAAACLLARDIITARADK
jgi:FdrA protein